VARAFWATIEWSPNVERVRLACNVGDGRFEGNGAFPDGIECDGGVSALTGDGSHVGEEHVCHRWIGIVDEWRHAVCKSPGCSWVPSTPP